MNKVDRLKKELKNARDGFTLIEMLVVIAVIGILASVIVVGLGGAREGSRDARRVADIRQIQNALELRYDNASGYPDPVSCDGVNGVEEEAGAGAPCFSDPQGVAYSYEAFPNDNGINTNYALGACLEGDDNDNQGDGSSCPGSLPSCTFAFCTSTN